MGHSAGGAFTQILLDHGHGAAGVALNSAPTEGVRIVPLSQVKSTFPVLKSPANRHKAVGLTFEQWQYAFTNTFPEDQARATYERYHIPAHGGILWGSVLANFQPGPQETWVDYANDNRAPLLFVSGSEDHIMPPAIQQSNRKHYKSNTVTEIREYEGYAHLLPAQEGWERIADEVLDWAAGARPLILTHIGGPTVLVEVDGWRLLTDPTFDPAGGHYDFGWGTSSDKLVGPAWAAADLPPIDAVLLTHDHHGDNLDAAGRALLPDVPAGWSPRSAGPVGSGWRASPGWQPGATTTLSARRAGQTSRCWRRRPGTDRRCPDRLVGDVVGFALRRPGQDKTLLWITGDTVLHRPLRRTAAAMQVDVALVHVGGVRFPITGPLRYTLTGRRAVELCDLVRPRVAVPVHYEGWAHFTDGRAAIRAGPRQRADRRPRPGPLAAGRRRRSTS